MSQRAYLDHNASAPLLPEAKAAALEAMAVTGNASSVHADGRRARSLLEDARAAVAALAGVAPREVVFTSGGTEANNLALNGCGRARVFVSAIEHPSVLRARPDAVQIPVTPGGRVDLAALERLLDECEVPALVSVMAANNETGVVQPLADVRALARRHSALFHCDAVQAAGRMDIRELGADLVTLSGHKIGGLQGAGALVVAGGVALAPQQRGGGQELGLRSGTEALPAIASMGAAAATVQDVVATELLRDRLEAAMVAAVPGSRVIGVGAPRLPNTIAIAHPAIDAETLVMAFDLAGVALSAGAACSSGKVVTSHVLQAMGEDAVAHRTIRISLGPATTAEDTARCLSAWQAIDRRIARRRSAA